MLARAIDRFEAGMTLNRVALIAAVLVFYQAIWLGAALYRMVVMAEVAPLGYDFSAFWSAAQLASEGRVIDSYNGAVIGPLERGVVPIPGTLYWHYPPTMSVLLWPFEHLGYTASFVLFTLLSCAALVTSARVIAPDASWLVSLIAVAMPGAYICILQGQNGTFVALLMVLFLVSLETKRPVVAAAWAAVLLFKPHFGVLLPLIVILRGDWRVFPWGLVFGGVFIGISLWRFGFAHWQAFFDNADILWAAMLTGELSYQQISAFAFFQLLGVPTHVALWLQGLTAVGAIGLTWAVWRDCTAGREMRLATVLTASLMVSPYAFYYDTALLGLAIFLLFLDSHKRGTVTGERLVYLFAFVAPGLHRYTTTAFNFSIVYLAIILVLWQIFRRLRLAQSVAKLNPAPAG